MTKKRASKSSTKAGTKRNAKGRRGGCNVVFRGGPLDGREMLIDDVTRGRCQFRHEVMSGGLKCHEMATYHYEKSDKSTNNGLFVFVLARTEKWSVTHRDTSVG